MKNNITFIWIPSHTGIKGNEDADSAAKEATDINEITNIRTTPNDIKLQIEKATKEKWNEEWSSTTEENKLRKFKTTTERWTTTGTRREQVALSRIRIGHTLITHKHLFTKTDPDYCTTCNSQSTIEHIICNCIKYTQIRQKYIIPNTIKEALKNSISSNTNLIKYLKETKLLQQI